MGRQIKPKSPFTPVPVIDVFFGTQFGTLWLISFNCLIPCCVNQFSTTVTKYLRSSRHKEKSFLLAHTFGGFSPRLVGAVVWGM